MPGGPPPPPELGDVAVELPALAQVAVVLKDHGPELGLGQGRLHHVDPPRGHDEVVLVLGGAVVDVEVPGAPGV